MGCSCSRHNNGEISSFTDKEREKSTINRVSTYEESSSLIRYKDGKRLESSKNEEKTMSLSNTWIKEDSIISEKEEENRVVDGESETVAKIFKNMDRLTKKAKKMEEDTTKKNKEIAELMKENKKLRDEKKELECENLKLEENLDLTLGKLEMAINLLKTYEKKNKKK